MNGGADNAASGAPSRGLFVAVEPPSEGRDAMVPALIAESSRLAGELGASLYLVTWPAEEGADPRPVAAALSSVVKEIRPLAVLLADTDIGRQLAPMVANDLESGAILGCSDVRIQRGGRGAGDSRSLETGGGKDVAQQAALVFVKPVFGGWLEREIEAASGVVPVATLDLTGMGAPDSPAEGLPAPRVLQVQPVPQPRVRSLEMMRPDPRYVDIVHASRVVAAGAGSASDELLVAVRELAELLEGSVGTTRPVVDDGVLPKERLIGQTGRTVTPDLYLALGISGSPHHLAGVKNAERIVSVNRDVRAPIFQFSDIGYVAELESVLPGFVQKIKDWRDAPESHE